MRITNFIIITAFIGVTSFVTPASSRINCQPVQIAHGRPRMKSRGRIISYKCHKGYMMLGEQDAACIKGKWDPDPPVCIKPGCTPIRTFLNGHIVQRMRSALIEFSCNPGYRLVGPSLVYCNGRKWSAMQPYCRAVDISCNFESVTTCGWRVDTHEDDDFMWSIQQHEPPSRIIGTGPKHDHTFSSNDTGHYLLIETSDFEPDEKVLPARIHSPRFPAFNNSTSCFVFWYHMFGNTVGMLNVFLNNKLVFQEKGNHGDRWIKGVVSLANASHHEIMIEGTYGGDADGDIGLDDFSIGTNSECLYNKVWGHMSRCALVLHQNGCNMCERKFIIYNYRSPTFFDRINSSGDVCEQKIKISSCKGRCHQDNSSETASCLCHQECFVDSSCCDDFHQLCTIGSTTISTLDSEESDTEEIETASTDLFSTIMQTTEDDSELTTSSETNPATTVTKLVPTTRLLTTLNPTTTPLTEVHLTNISLKVPLATTVKEAAVPFTAPQLANLSTVLYPTDTATLKDSVQISTVVQPASISTVQYSSSFTSKNITKLPKTAPTLSTVFSLLPTKNLNQMTQRYIEKFTQVTLTDSQQMTRNITPSTTVRYTTSKNMVNTKATDKELMKPNSTLFISTVDLKYGSDHRKYFTTPLVTVKYTSPLYRASPTTRKTIPLKPTTDKTVWSKAKLGTTTYYGIKTTSKNLIPTKNVFKTSTEMYKRTNTPGSSPKLSNAPPLTSLTNKFKKTYTLNAFTKPKLFFTTKKYYIPFKTKKTPAFKVSESSTRLNMNITVSPTPFNLSTQIPFTKPLITSTVIPVKASQLTTPFHNKAINNNNKDADKINFRKVESTTKPILFTNPTTELTTNVDIAKTVNSERFHKQKDNIHSGGKENKNDNIQYVIAVVSIIVVLISTMALTYFIVKRRRLRFVNDSEGDVLYASSEEMLDLHLSRPNQL